jgi:hypothetical protein
LKPFATNKKTPQLQRFFMLLVRPSRAFLSGNKNLTPNRKSIAAKETRSISFGPLLNPRVNSFAFLGESFT